MNLKRFNRALVPSCFKESEILYAKCRLYISSKLSRSEMTLTVRRNQNSFHDLLKCATTIAAKHDHERYFGTGRQLHLRCETILVELVRALTRLRDWHPLFS